MAEGGDLRGGAVHHRHHRRLRLRCPGGPGEQGGARLPHRRRVLLPQPSVRERGEHRLHPPGPHGHAPGPEGESQGGVLHLLPLRKGHRQDPQKGGGGVHRSHHRRQGRGQEGDHLRDRRPGLPRDGPHAPAGHQPGGGPGRAGLPARHRQKGEAGEDDLIVEI